MTAPTEAAYIAALRVKANAGDASAQFNLGYAYDRGQGVPQDYAHADTGALRDAVAKYRDVVGGVKARLSRDVAGENDEEVLRRAQEVATAFNLPLMIHMGQTRSPLSRLFDRLKPGDIVTHMFAPPPNSIIDDNGRVLPEVLAARRRGVWFDVGNGQTGHMRWDVIARIMQAGFWPDTFSTDWNVNSPTTGVIDFPNCMSKLFGYGMTVPQAIACATVNAARSFDVFHDRGTRQARSRARPLPGSVRVAVACRVRTRIAVALLLVSGHHTSWQRLSRFATKRRTLD